MTNPEAKARQKERMRVYHKEYYQRPEVKKHKREYMREYQPQYMQHLRKQFFEMYGGSCMCCGEKDVRFLTLDHVNGNGAVHRRRLSQIGVLREALSNLNTEEYQILCYNCNLGKAINDGVCPHHKDSASTNPSIIHSHSKGTRQRRNLRTRLFKVYGSVCACCGESEERFLTLDHKLNDGNHAREESKQIKIMREAISEADPRKYQVLCFNCNCARSQHNGICPHLDVK